MNKNQFKIAFRQFFKNKTTSLINLSGLTIGLAVSMLIGLYVWNEWQTDRHLPHADRTYRLLRVSDINNEPYDIGVTSGPFAPALLQDYPDDVEEAVRVLDGNSLVTIEEQIFQEQQYYYVDSNFFSFFEFPLVYGNPTEVLNQPNTVVLSQATARRYFGDEKSAVGKTIKIDNSYDAIVTGVFRDLKTKSHMQFDIVESNLSFGEARWWTDWWSNSSCTYLRLKPGVSKDVFEAKLPSFMDRYFGDDFISSGTRVDLKLEPQNDIYFKADTRYDPMQHGDRKAVNIFFLAALLLIAIACANYINLSTARAVKRGKEMGIYKVLGSGKRQIVTQIVAESFLLTSIAILLATQIVFFTIPFFNATFGVSLQIEWAVWQIAAVLFLLALIIAVASGLYPGLHLSSFRPAQVLKGNQTTNDRSSSSIRKALVIFQFILSIGLLCSTLIIQRQLDYLNSKQLGFDKEHVLTISLSNSEIRANRESFRQRLLQHPGVSNVSFISGVPGGFHDATSVDVPSLGLSTRMRTAFVDFDFVNTMGLEMVAGRNFNAELASDSTEVAILNEQAVKDLGLSPNEILDRKVYLTFFDTIPRKVIGIVKDYHFSSLHDDIEPLVISTNFQGRLAAIKVDAGRIPEVIAATESTWKSFAPDFPFAYQFLDERLDRLYQSELQQGRIFGLFAFIAILIACLGMFGLAVFAANTRIKEIGIRKVLGATTTGIVSLLSKDFLKPVIIAILIAAPLTYFLMNKWLNDFAYHIELGWGVFVFAGLVALLIAFATISLQSVKAAMTNPVKSLRNE